MLRTDHCEVEKELRALEIKMLKDGTWAGNVV